MQIDGEAGGKLEPFLGISLWTKSFLLNSRDESRLVVKRNVS
jgi:hypothetical protein